MDPHQDPALDALVKAKAIRYEAPAELRERIGAALTRSDSSTASPARAARAAAWRQWLNMGIAFACGLIASVAVIQLFPMADEQDRLAQEVVSAHVRSLMVAHLADVTSTDQHTVKPWFTGKLDFSPPIYDLALPELVESFIRQCARNGKALKTVGSAVLVECRDKETAEAIAAHKETEALCLRAGPRTLVVRSDHLERFRERVRVLGFGMAP